MPEGSFSLRGTGIKIPDNNRSYILKWKSVIFVALLLNTKIAVELILIKV